MAVSIGRHSPILGRFTLVPEILNPGLNPRYTHTHIHTTHTKAPHTDTDTHTHTHTGSEPVRTMVVSSRGLHILFIKCA
jgi:hypothetical protein